jgi:flavin reductase
MFAGQHEDHPMPVPGTTDSSNFLHAMRRWAAAVSVVTCSDEDGWHGMTATAVTSVCAEPPSLLVCINRAGAFYERLAGAGIFCVNLLGLAHVEISQAFGGRLKGAERFEKGKWAAIRCLPCLIDAQANLFCRTALVTEFGTHGIVIGRVEDVRFAGDAAPLVYQDGHYARTAGLENTMSDGRDSEPNP